LAAQIFPVPRHQRQLDFPPQVGRKSVLGNQVEKKVSVVFLLAAHLCTFNQ
jgi:hypothetical protein